MPIFSSFKELFYQVQLKGHWWNSNGFDFEDASTLNAKWNSLSVKKKKSNAATEEVIFFFLSEIIVYKFQLYTSSVLTFNKIDCAFKEGEI